MNRMGDSVSFYESIATLLDSSNILDILERHQRSGWEKYFECWVSPLIKISNKKLKI